MNVEKLYRIADFVIQDTKNYKLVELFETFISTLTSYSQNLASNFQIDYANARDNFFQALDNSKYNDMSYLDKNLLEEIGGSELLGINLKITIENAITPDLTLPAKMLQNVAPIRDKFTSYINHLKSLATTLNALKISKETPLDKGEGEISILMPRNIIEGKLKTFNNDIKVFNSFLDTITEIVGEEESFYELSTISSSDFIINILADCAVVTTISITINNILDIFQKGLDIAKTIQDMQKQDAPKKAIEEYKKFYETTIENGIKNAVKEIFAKHKQNNKERKNELENKLAIILNQIVQRINKGYQLTVTLNSCEDEDQTDDEGNVISAPEKIKTLHENVRKLNNNTDIIVKKIAQDGEIFKIPILKDENLLDEDEPVD